MKDESLKLEEEQQNESITAKTEWIAKNSEKIRFFVKSKHFGLKLETKTFNKIRMEEAA